MPIFGTVVAAQSRLVAPDRRRRSRARGWSRRGGCGWASARPAARDPVEILAAAGFASLGDAFGDFADSGVKGHDDRLLARRDPVRACHGSPLKIRRGAWRSSGAARRNLRCTGLRSYSPAVPIDRRGLLGEETGKRRLRLIRFLALGVPTVSRILAARRWSSPRSASRSSISATTPSDNDRANGRPAPGGLRPRLAGASASPFRSIVRRLPALIARLTPPRRARCGPRARSARPRPTAPRFRRYSPSAPRSNAPTPRRSDRSSATPPRPRRGA